MNLVIEKSVMGYFVQSISNITKLCYRIRSPSTSISPSEKQPKIFPSLFS
nr:MAG TPA: hypothetical protein [Caudoviricetes sp.]